MAITGLSGAIFDPNSTQALGGLSTCIGAGTNAIYGPPLPEGMALGEGPIIARIGSPPPYGARAQATVIQGKAILLQKATANTAPGGTFAGVVNQTGKTIPAGSYAYGNLP